MIIPRKRAAKTIDTQRSKRPNSKQTSSRLVVGPPYERLLIAVDGPVSSGKSALSRKLARRFNAVHLNSGLIYRSLALSVQTAGISNIDIAAICQVAQALEFSLILNSDGTSALSLHGELIGNEVEDESIAQRASQLAELSEVRKILTFYQQQLIQQFPRVVLEGRDAGSVVAKDAQIKFYIDCPLEDRVFMCRQRLSQRTGRLIDSEEVHNLIVARDTRDLERSCNPLRRVPEALLVDNGLGRSVLPQMVDYVHQRMRSKVISDYTL